MQAQSSGRLMVTLLPMIYPLVCSSVCPGGNLKTIAPIDLMLFTQEVLYPWF